VRQNPYDGFFCLGGIFCPVEMKSIKEAGRFPVECISSHQVEGLKAVLRHGGCPFLAVNYRKATNAAGKMVRANRAFILPFSRWEALVDEMRAAGRLSAPFTWLAGEVWFAEMPRLPKHERQAPVWDLPTGLKAACRMARHPAYAPLLTALETGFYDTRNWEKVEGVAL
jgi:hypothetical protein